MKKTKPLPRTKAPAVAPPSRRQIALQKLRGLATVVGLLALGGGMIVVAMNPDLVWPTGRRALGDEQQEKPGEKPLKLNPNTPPAGSPDGMVWVPGGEFW